MQKDGDGRLKGTTLGMEKLYKHLFKSDLPGTVDTTLTQHIKHPLLLFFPGAHRALADVRAMKAIFTHLNCLDDVEIRSPNQQLMLWKSQKMAYKRTTSLVASLGKPSITAPQAKRLDFLGFTFESLLDLYCQASDQDAFTTVLKGKGVNSRPLRAKLVELLKAKKAVEAK